MTAADLAPILKELLHPNTFLHHQCARWKKYIHRRRVPLDAAAIRAALHQLGTIAGPAVMIHSSLSACGQVQGGVPTVLEELKAWAGPVTMAMPAHSYCYPDHEARRGCFDPASTPSAVGAISECFRRQPGAVRSAHPTHSLACAGPLAKEICADHDWAETPCGHGTPYEKLVQLDGAVLLFGATMDAYTLFHTAEDAAEVPYLYQPRRCDLLIRDRMGLEWSLPSWRHDMTVPRRFSEMDTWLEQRGLLHRATLGRGELLFVPHAAAAHRALVDALRSDPWLLVAESARPMPPAP